MMMMKRRRMMMMMMYVVVAGLFSLPGFWQSDTVNTGL